MSDDDDSEGKRAERLSRRRQQRTEERAERGGEDAEDAEGEEAGGEDVEGEVEWEPTTLYLPREVRRELRRRVDDVVWEAEDAGVEIDKRDVHRALVELAIEEEWEAVSDRSIM